MKEQSRYKLLQDDERFGLKAGDILICQDHHPAWANEKIAVVCRESDGFVPGCSQYRQNVEYVSGPVLLKPAEKSLLDNFRMFYNLLETP